MSTRVRAWLTLLVVIAASTMASAHAGPPFPIVTGEVRGPYAISIWTDPDATDNGMPGGQFWVVIESATKGVAIPEGTRATVSLQPLTAAASSPSQPSSSSPLTAVATPVRGDVTNQFAALLMAHEGPFAVHVEISGALGQTIVDTKVDATYDLRPPPYMLAWYLAPFLLAGLLWTRLLLRRRGAPRGPV